MLLKRFGDALVVLAPSDRRRGALPGRGASLHADLRCIRETVKRRRLPSALGFSPRADSDAERPESGRSQQPPRAASEGTQLKTSGPSEAEQALARLVKEALLSDTAGTMQSARRRGVLYVGPEAVAPVLGRAQLLLVARDAPGVSPTIAGHGGIHRHRFTGAAREAGSRPAVTGRGTVDFLTQRVLGSCLGQEEVAMVACLDASMAKRIVTRLERVAALGG